MMEKNMKFKAATVIDYALVAYFLPYKNRRFDIVKLSDLAARNSFVWAGEEVYLKDTNPQIDCWILMITDDLDYMNNNFEEITEQYLRGGYHKSEEFPNVPYDNSPPFSTKSSNKKVKLSKDCLCTRPCRHNNVFSLNTERSSLDELISNSEKSHDICEDLSKLKQLENHENSNEKLREMDKRVEETQSAFKQLLADYNKVATEKDNLLKVLYDIRLKLESGISKMQNVTRTSGISSSCDDITPMIKYYDGKRDLQSALDKLRSVENIDRNIMEITPSTPESSSDHELRMNNYDNHQQEASSSNRTLTPTSIDGTPVNSNYREPTSSPVISTTAKNVIVVPSGPLSHESTLTTSSSSHSFHSSDNEIQHDNLPNAKRQRSSRNSSLSEKYYQKENSDHESSEDDNEMVTIGESGRTKIRKALFNSIKTNKYTVMTRVLLKTLFTRETLATSSMTGKMSPAFLNSDKKPRKPLDPVIVQDIVQCVSKCCNVLPSIVRSVITTKCADEYKMLKLRQKKMGKENLFK